MYCSVCGEEIRIVPDYEPEIFIELSESISSIAEDFETERPDPEKEAPDQESLTAEEASRQEFKSSLRRVFEASFQKDDDREQKERFREGYGEYLDEDQSEADRKENRRQSKKGSGKSVSRLLLAVIVTAGTLFVALFLVAIFRFNRYYDFDIQYASALSLHDEGKYEESLGIAKHALSINKEEDKTKFLIADDYYELKKYDESNAVLFGMLSDAGKPDVNVYDRIINNYLAEENYDGIVELILNSGDEEIKERYLVYLADAPVFGKPGGEYENDIEVTLSSDTPGVIYYTTDGSVPDIDSTVYRYPIKVEEGDTTISAVFVNEYGIKSQEVSETFSVSYPQAREPKLLVSGGNYEIPRLIRVEYPEGYKVYYTTNGKDPDTQSNEYTKALDMPIGSSQYRFMAVDEKGRTSEIVSAQYNLKMVCFIDLKTAINTLKIQLMSKGENSLLNEYKCNYGYGYEDNSFYLIDEYTYSGSRTGRRFAVDTKTGSIFEAQWSSSKDDYTLKAI